MKKGADLFSKNLKSLMSNRGMKPLDLSKEVKATVQNVNNWLNGRNRPRPDKLKAIADYFGITSTMLTHGNIAAIEQKKAAPDIPVEAADTLRILKARSYVILVALSELLSAHSGRLSAKELVDLEAMVNDRLNAGEKAG